MWLITYLGPNALTGGTGFFTLVSGSIVLIIFSLAILALAIYSGTPNPEEAKTTIMNEVWLGTE